jgi:hypothetical protein
MRVRIWCSGGSDDKATRPRSDGNVDETEVPDVEDSNVSSFSEKLHNFISKACSHIIWRIEN